MNICKSCGAAVADTNKFCPSCGKPVTQNKEPVPSGGRNKKTLKIAIIIAAAAAFLCMAIPISLTFAKDAKVKSSIDVGNKYLTQGKYEEAILAFEKVISIDKKNIDARFKLTEAYLKTQRFEDANRICMEILDINPSDKGIYIKLADLMITEGRKDDAIQYLKKVLDKTGDSLVQKKLEGLKAILPPSTLEASVLQGDSYQLPDKVKLSINEKEGEYPVKWENTSVDTKTSGTYTFEGSVEEYNRKVRLTLEVKPKDLFLTNGKEVTMDKKQKEAMDHLFSIFSSLFVNPFENSNISDDELIKFGLLYIDRHEWDAKVKQIPNTSDASIMASDVDEVCLNYFGKKPSSHKTIDGYNYKDGKYTFGIASGEIFIGSKTDQLFDLGDNFYRANISTYAESDFEDAEARDKRKAVIKKVIENGTERYILISYRTNVESSTPSTPATPSPSTDLKSWQASASSVLTEKTGAHPARHVNDGDVGTAWVEGAKNDGIGEWIMLSGGQQDLTGLSIINGYAKSTDLYTKNNRVKKIRIELSDGTVLEKSLSDGTLGFQTINFDNQVKIDFVKITVLDVYKGSKYSDTCISEIELY